MTEEGAKRVLRNYRVVVAGFIDCREAIDIAINALEKQIPKKPKITRTSACITFGICPNCGTEIDCLDNPFYHIDSDCLQKLDWSEV